MTTIILVLSLGLLAVGGAVILIANSINKELRAMVPPERFTDHPF